jgi:hypothetical protein
VKWLTSYCDRIRDATCAANLFDKAPTLCFYPEDKAAVEGDLKVLKSRKKTLVTLDIGPFRAVERILVNPTDGRIYHSQQLRLLAPQRCTYGYDVLVYVGYGLFVGNCTESRIIEELARRNVSISQTEIGFLGRKFIVYLAIAHQQSRHRLKEQMALRGGYILHLDGTCEGDSPHLFTGIDGIAQIVLDNVKLASEKAELIIPFLSKIKHQYGDPLALVHDMGQGILLAVQAVFGAIPDFICHFHFLRDIGKDLFGSEYNKIRMRLKKHKIRRVLRKKAKVLEKIINEDPQGITRFMCDLDDGQWRGSVLKSMPACAVYTMIHWVFDSSDQLEGYGFPFDCPHLVFYQKLRALHDFVKQCSGAKDAESKRAMRGLIRPLIKIVEDQQLERASLLMEEKVEVFEKLRKALSIAVAGDKRGLNDDGLGADINSIENEIIRFRQEIMADQTLYQRAAYKKMIEQIDKYWDKLFADPITVNGPRGRITIQPQRTNNILERLFRDLKRGSRKKTGTASLSKTLKSILADTPLVKNLDNAEYLEVILDGSSTLEERFSKIDSHLVIKKLNAEKKENARISPEVKKIIRLPNLPERLTTLLSHSNINANRHLL